jgi:hypothetical protein
MTRPGWKLFFNYNDSLTHASNGGIAIYRISDSCSATMFAPTDEDCRKAAESLGISNKHVQCKHLDDLPCIPIVGLPLERALKKCLVVSLDKSSS